MDLTPSLLSNVDYVFALQENILNNRKQMYDYFFGIVPTFFAFDEIMKEVTKGYRCLVLDNTDGSGNLENCLFHYKSEQRWWRRRVLYKTT